MNKIVSVMVLALLCAACRTGKEYSRPPVSLPRVYRGGDEPANDSGDHKVLAWKAFFTDHALQEIIDRVLQSNYDLATAMNTIRLNSEYLRQAKVAWLPAISAGVSTGSDYYANNSINGSGGFNLPDRGIGHIDDYTVALGISWEADIWGKVKKQKKEALANWLESQEAKQAVQTRLIASAASAYYTIIMLHQQLAIARKNLTLSDSMVRIIRVQLQNGAATALALAQAEVQHKSTQAIIPDLEEALFIQENALRLLMAQHPGAVPLTAADNTFRLPDLFSAGIPVALLSNRPDIRQKEFELLGANARVGIAKANLYPALSITAAGGLNAFQAFNWISFPASLFGNIAGNLTQPVFNRRRLKTAVHISEINYQQKVNEFRNAVLTASAEVSDGLISAEKLKEKITISQSVNTLLIQAISDAGLLFRNGMADYLEVITVQQNLLQNQLHLALLKKQQATAYIALFRALGGGAE